MFAVEADTGAEVPLPVLEVVLSCPGAIIGAIRLSMKRAALS
jgi:hypothetical protein